VDVPTYFANVRGLEGSGFSDVAPAVKWQISTIPGKVDLSAVFGVALPTGSASITGRGAQLYLQFPWSWKLRNGWGLSGMFTEFIRPSDPTSKLITEATFVIEKNVTERASLFGEYVGDYPENGSPCPTVELGRTVSPQSNSAGGFPRRPGAQPQRAQLHCGHQIFGTFR